MSYSVFVLDRGRPIAKHAGLELEVAEELVRAYLAIGWATEKVLLQAEEQHPVETKAAA